MNPTLAKRARPAGQKMRLHHLNRLTALPFGGHQGQETSRLAAAQSYPANVPSRALPCSGGTIQALIPGAASQVLQLSQLLHHHHLCHRHYSQGLMLDQITTVTKEQPEARLALCTTTSVLHGPV